MLLAKELWTKEDVPQYLEYLKQFQNPEKEEWSRKILNTKQKLLCMKTQDLYNIAKEISKGNYMSYLDLKIFDYYETVAIYGKLIVKIKDFFTMKRYLDIYSSIMENWAHCDLLDFTITKDNKKQFLALSEDYIKSDLLFVRRLSLSILLNMIRDESILDDVFKRLKALENEEEYYVIMMGGWLLSECLIRYKEATLEYLVREDINKKIVNKAIQKCRESRRLTTAQKDELLIYKR
ncbi:MAG: DNA alkylation repair protein [Bacilli bacterium]|nr:DNA alkylation repair protein [Bacilli bacterium]